MVKYFCCNFINVILFTASILIIFFIISELEKSDSSRYLHYQDWYENISSNSAQSVERSCLKVSGGRNPDDCRPICDPEALALD